MTERAGGPNPGGLAKAYQPAEVEGPIYERWLAADVFAPDGAGSTADPSLPPFVIIQPPPNVTGSLHLGHAQRSSVEDLMVRHARMTGRQALWLPGLDHASIAAQFVLDRILAGEGETRQSLGRERYLERMWRFVETTRGVMLTQQRRVGASLDWSRLRFTMDEFSARAVRESFTRLHREGLAYRTEALINWCPGCRTSVSDLEVVPTPETGSLWSVRYHLLAADGSGRPDPDPAATITVATTRPETILGDTAVAVHPDDPRYRAFVGRTAVIPFVDRPVPDRRRRVRGPRVRDRRREDHPRPRPRRLRDGQASRPPDDRHPRGRRATERRRRAVRRHGPVRGPEGGRGAAGGRRRPGGHEAARDAHRALPALERHHRAAPQDAVVHPDEAAGRGRARGDAIRAHDDPPGALRQGLGALAHRDPRLERQPPALVGPPHPGLVLPGRARDGVRGSGRSRPPARRAVAGRGSSSRTPTSSTPGTARACGRFRPSAGRSRRRTSPASTRVRSWRRPTTSSSSGSPG